MKIKKINKLNDLDLENFKGVYFFQVDNLKIRILENYTPFSDNVNIDLAYEITIGGNRVVFDILEPPVDFNDPKKYPKYLKTINKFIEHYKNTIYNLSKLKKFEFYNDDTRIIRHNIAPRFFIRVIKNDDAEYDVLNDVYELFEYKGNQFVFLIFQSEIDLDEIKDFRLIRSILKRSWKNFYLQNVNIEKHSKDTEGVWETERYILQESTSPNWWVCTDKEVGIVCKWENHKFNETQQVTELENFKHSNTSEVIQVLNSAMRYMGTWLRDNHYNKIF